MAYMHHNSSVSDDYDNQKMLCKHKMWEYLHNLSRYINPIDAWQDCWVDTDNQNSRWGEDTGHGGLQMVDQARD